MSLKNLSITIPHPNGKPLPAFGVYNIELGGFTLESVSEGLVSFGDKNYYSYLFKVIDRCGASDDALIEVKKSLDLELGDSNIAGFLVFFENKYDARVLMLEEENGEPSLRNYYA